VGFEIVSKTPGGEYDDKMAKYAQIECTYIIYNPDYWKDKHDRFEVYRLVNGAMYARGVNCVDARGWFRDWV